jgi:hypothetical protein
MPSGNEFASMVAADAPLPEWFASILAPFRKEKRFGASLSPQFYLGPAGSGAPVHFHGHGEIAKIAKKA